MMMPTYTYTSSQAFERDDIELVKMFLSQFKDNDGRTYAIKARPEIEERKTKAVEAIAVAEEGRTLAIEHTYIQSFEGQKSDDVPFLKVFEQLEKDPPIRIPSRFIELWAHAFAIPNGVRWEDVATQVRQWFVDTASKFPVDGQAMYSIPGCGFELNVLVQTFELPATDGSITVGRILPSGEPFAAVLEKALNQKVPKLAATPADKRILLLEDGGVAIGFAKIGKGLDASIEKLQDLKKVDAVWATHTMEWKSRGNVMFIRVWPGWTGQRFWIDDKRFSKPK